LEDGCEAIGNPPPRALISLVNGSSVLLADLMTLELDEPSSVDVLVCRDTDRLLDAV
jgi:hypothetical protein